MGGELGGEAGLFNGSSGEGAQLVSSWPVVGVGCPHIRLRRTSPLSPLGSGGKCTTCQQTYAILIAKL